MTVREAFEKAGHPVPEGKVRVQKGRVIHGPARQVQHEQTATRFEGARHTGEPMLAPSEIMAFRQIIRVGGIILLKIVRRIGKNQFN